MRIIHGGGYSDDEKKGYKQQIYGNVYIAIQNLTNAMSKLKVSFESTENEVWCSIVLTLGHLSSILMTLIYNNNTSLIK